MSQPPPPKDAHLRCIPGPSGSAGQNKFRQGLLSRRLPGAWFLATPRKFHPLGLSARGSVCARGAVSTSLPPGRKRARARLTESSPARDAGARPPGRERTHLGEEVVHCSRALPNSPESGSQLAEVSPAEGPGKPCVSQRDSQKLEPAGLPRCHLLLPFSSFAPFVCPNPSL